MNLLHRVRQFYFALVAPFSPNDYSLIEQVLQPELYALFMQLDPAERNHSVRVFETLTAEGYTDQDLLAAALLHDVGKSRFPIRLYERVLVVLLSPIMRKSGTNSRAEQPGRLVELFCAAEEHPDWGADLVMQAGGSEKLVWLIRMHQYQMLHAPANTLEEHLIALQSADKKN